MKEQTKPEVRLETFTSGIPQNYLNAFFLPLLKTN